MTAMSSAVDLASGPPTSVLTGSAGPMFALYVVGIVVAFVFGRRRARQEGA